MNPTVAGPLKPKKDEACSQGSSPIGQPQEQDRQLTILKAVLDCMADGVAVADETGRLVLLNASAHRIIGADLSNYTREEWGNRPGVFRPDMTTRYPAESMPISRAILGESVDGVEMYLKPTDEASATWITVAARPISDPRGEPRGGVAVFRDISAQKRAERNLATSESQMRDILDNTPAVVFVKDRDGRYLLVNRTYETLFHVSRNDIQGRTDLDIFPLEVALKFRENDREVVESGQALQFEEIAPHDDGIHTYVCVKFPLFDERGRPTALCGIATDITKRKQAEEELQNEQRFMRKLIAAHERDRQLMAYEVHDGLLQDISGALLHLESIPPEDRGANPSSQAVFERTLRLLRRAIGEGRRILSGLRPPILDEEGIVPAIQYLAAEQSTPSRLKIEFRSQVGFGRLDPLLESTVFRVVQEALTNTRKHSQATHAEVELVESQGRLRLKIHDNGVGFTPAPADGARLGLEGIRKRVSILGGRIEIESAPGAGTTLDIEFPLTPIAD